MWCLFFNSLRPRFPPTPFPESTDNVPTLPGFIAPPADLSPHAPRSLEQRIGIFHVTMPNPTPPRRFEKSTTGSGERRKTIGCWRPPPSQPRIAFLESYIRNLAYTPLLQSVSKPKAGTTRQDNRSHHRWQA